MDAVVDVTVMRVLLFVLHVCMLTYYEGAMVTAMLGWVIRGGVGAGCEYMSGTRGLGLCLLPTTCYR